MLGGSALRVAQKLLFVVTTVLVLPIAVNVGTGGTPPPWLARSWTGPGRVVPLRGAPALALAAPTRGVRHRPQPALAAAVDTRREQLGQRTPS